MTLFEIDLPQTIMRQSWPPPAIAASSNACPIPPERTVFQRSEPTIYSTASGTGPNLAPGSRPANTLSVIAQSGSTLILCNYSHRAQPSGVPRERWAERRVERHMKKSVLIVEDNPIIAQAMARLV